MFSTRNLGDFPEPGEVVRCWKIAALLDAIFCDEPDRYHTFDSRWSKRLKVGKIDNGSGDEMFGLFSEHGAVIKGFSHESEMSPYQNDDREIWPGIYDSVPERLLKQLDDPAFSKSDVTFCIWRQPSDAEWKIGQVDFSDVDDGSADLLGTLFFDAEDYCEWAEEYFEVDLDADAVAAVFRGDPITRQLVAAINPEAEFSTLKRDATEIGIDLA